MGDWIVSSEDYWWRTYHFPVIVKPEEGFDFSRIYPIKQKNVRRAIDLVKQMPWVKELWVFGSAACNRCNWGSDLDIAILYDADIMSQCNVTDPSGDLSSIDENGVDMLILNKINREDTIYKEIMRGVCYVNSNYKKSSQYL